MSVLKSYFDKSVNQSSPVQEDLKRIVSYDEDGKEIITWEPFDYSAIQNANGSAELWSLKSLLSAGIDPSFPIHTGLNTRLAGVEVVQKAAAYADTLFPDNLDNNDEK